MTATFGRDRHRQTLRRVCGVGGLVLDHPDAAAEDLGVEERAHQLLVRAVAQRLGLVAERVGVLDRVVAQLAGEPAGDDLLGRPLVDGVGGGLDLEHAVRQVLAHARGLEPGAAGGALERLELRPALVDGDDAALGIEVRLDQRVLVLARDLARPSRWRGGARSAPRARPSGPRPRRVPSAARRARRLTRARSVPVMRDQPRAVAARARWLAPELEPQAGVGGHGDRRAGRDLGRVDHAATRRGPRRGAAAPATA